MKICYIPPKSDKREYALLPMMASTAITTKGNWLEDAISEALRKVVIDPFKKWALTIWLGFMDFSYAFCLSVAIAGIICGMLGIKKGYKAAVLSIVFYFMLSLITWACGWR